MTNRLSAYLSRVVNLTDATIERLLPPEDQYPPLIHQVMRYSIFAGGKRIRPALIMASYEACGGMFGSEPVAQAAAAIEMLHTFSLMHDDLPCMDDDDFRRGKPTAHKAFSEALAVLGGDALCVCAFEVLARVGRLDIVSETAKTLGTSGVIGGQVVDIESEGKQIDIETIKYIHLNKTAALIRLSVRVGAMLADPSPVHLERLTTYGTHVGLAFQVIDDILDEIGTTGQLGKNAGSDRQRGKATYPAVLGLEASREYARKLSLQAQESIAFLGKRGTILGELSEYLLTRIS